MTVIAAIETEDKVYIGADSAISCGTFQERSVGKLFRVGDLVFGSSGSVRLGQVIQFATTLPTRTMGQTAINYLVHIGKAIAETIETHKLKADDNHVSMVIVYEKKLYRIHSDYAVIRPYRGYTAAGCGVDYALGAIAVLLEQKTPPRDALQKALEIAATFEPGAIAPPFDIWEVD
jgi:ATP-dependent protease HslVU (ClpYQ) peptidase subunit